MKKKKILRGVLAAVFVCFAVVALAGGTRLWLERRQLDRDRELQRQLTSAPAAAVPVETAPAEPEEGENDAVLRRYDGVRRQCAPFAGWLALPGEDGLSRVVVQGEDNDFYLSHNYLGEDSVAGELFLDWTCDPENSRNRIVYGHRMKHGQMFSALVPYADEAYTREHPEFYYSDGTEEYCAEIFAVRRLKPTDPALFTTDFDREEDFLAYVQDARDNALYRLETEVGEGDSIVILYTCDYTFQNARLLVCAVLRPVPEDPDWLAQFALPAAP